MGRRSLAQSIIGAALLALAPSCAPDAPSTDDRAGNPPVTCSCTLGSWRVMGRARHLYIDIDCPDEHAHLSGRVEFTTALNRRDYVPAPGVRPPLARMTRGHRLYPVWRSEDDYGERVEAEFEITLGQARELQRDRVFLDTYSLLGPNSNTGVREAMEDTGLELPRRVLSGGGALGEFPGIDSSLIGEAPPEAWPSLGLPDGPARMGPGG